MEYHVNGWAKLTGDLTWKEVADVYLETLQRCETYMTAHPEARASSPVSLAMGGLATVYIGLRPILGNAARYDERASPEMAEVVLALARKVQKDVPVPDHIGHA